jgi:hypothetical protein
MLWTFCESAQSVWVTGRMADGLVRKWGEEKAKSCDLMTENNSLRPYTAEIRATCDPNR